MKNIVGLYQIWFISNSVLVTKYDIKLEAPNLKVNINDNSYNKNNLFLYINLIPNAFEEE